MTKRLLILIMALLLVCASCLADEQVVVDSFKVHVQDIMQPVLATYKKDAVHIRYFDPSKHGLQGSGQWTAGFRTLVQGAESGTCLFFGC